MTAKRTKSATPPRKAAKTRTGGAANGAAPLPPASDAELRAPELHEYKPPPESEPPVAAAPVEAEPPAHPYGDRLVFTFHPKNVRDGESKDPIIVPHITTLDADVEFFWELDAMDPMHQAFAYMKKAEIPRYIQRRVVRLPQAELARFLSDWFMGVLLPQGVGPPGES